MKIFTASHFYVKDKKTGKYKKMREQQVIITIILTNISMRGLTEVQHCFSGL